MPSTVPITSWLGNRRSGQGSGVADGDDEPVANMLGVVDGVPDDVNVMDGVGGMASVSQ